MTTITCEERIHHYVGNMISQSSVQIKDYERASDMMNKRGSLNFGVYQVPLNNLLKKYRHQDKKFKYKMMDIQCDVNDYCFVKNRTIHDNKPTILRSLNFNRHWNHFYNKPNDIKYEQKINRIYWRGTTTGKETNKGNRFQLMKQWFGVNDNIDIAFSHICQGKNGYIEYVKGKVDIHEFLKYKYILSVEGNDKDSGISWKLNSNSLVFMTRPTKVSWLMEDKLIPDYHYVLLKDDFSDLLEKYEWCENNPDQCVEIINNANNYMRLFDDNKHEEQLEKQVIDEYFKRVKCV